MRLHAGIALALCAAHGTAQQWVCLDGPWIPGRGVAFDSRRSRTVVFGSEGETWEYDQGLRLHRPAANGPFGRQGHAMVYDPARGRTFLFGGLAQGPVADTWTWDGCTWQQLGSTLTPPRRNQPAMAFDSARNRVVLFGGITTDNVLLDDTWEHDGSQWLPCTPATVPPQGAVQLAFDSTRNVTVLVVSQSTVAQPMQVFEWNGVDWSPRSFAAPTPVAHAGFSLCFDARRGRTVMCGGIYDIWEWDGSTWHLAPVTMPIGISNPGLCFDSVRGATVIFGGRESGGPTLAWSYDGATIAPVSPNISPPCPIGVASFHDDVRHRTIRCGGVVFATWEWDGLRWTRRTPPVSPPGRQNTMVCFEPQTGTGFLFGGLGPSVPLADTWRWDGTTWSALPGPSPVARSEGALAWDAGRGEAILFGGLDASFNLLNDTWRWNGQWSQVLPTQPPSPRARVALTNDQSRARLVMFGGVTNNLTSPLLQNDTWEWDGAQWQPVGTVQAPPGLMSPGMVYDPVRGRTLLAGLNPVTSTLRHLQVWTFDGSTWTQIASGAANSIAVLQLVFDSQRNRPVLIDCSSVRELTTVPADISTLGSGCGAPAPLLAARERPRIGEPTFGLELWTAANLPVLFALAFGQGSTAIGNGCTLLLQQVAATTFVMANGSGLAVQPIPLPANQTLRGLVLFAQAGALDPAAPGGLAVSHALRLTIGD